MINYNHNIIIYWSTVSINYNVNSEYRYETIDKRWPDREILRLLYRNVIDYY